MGFHFKLSSVQAALLCGMGLQQKGVNELVSELQLPINQVLAMFNKAMKKMSLAFHNLLVDEESKRLLGGNAMKQAEKKVHRIRDVVGQTLEEDATEGATSAMKVLQQGEQLPQKEKGKEKNKTGNSSGVTG